jgi:hypothetical protein
VLAHVESAEIIAAPDGCAVSQADSHAASAHPSAQSRRAVQSASPKHAFASAQQLPSRHASHVASPLAKPHALVVVGEGPPPQAVPQLDSTHVERPSSSEAPVGCAVKQPEKHASSEQASPHAMSAVQSASEAHAVSSAQQLDVTHVSHEGSPVDSPQAPASPANRTWEPP